MRTGRACGRVSLLHEVVPEHYQAAAVSLPCRSAVLYSTAGSCKGHCRMRLKCSHLTSSCPCSRSLVLQFAWAPGAVVAIGCKEKSTSLIYILGGSSFVRFHDAGLCAAELGARAAGHAAQPQPQRERCAPGRCLCRSPRGLGACPMPMSVRQYEIACPSLLRAHVRFPLTAVVRGFHSTACDRVCCWSSGRLGLAPLSFAAWPLSRAFLGMRSDGVVC